MLLDVCRGGKLPVEVRDGHYIDEWRVSGRADKEHIPRRLLGSKDRHHVFECADAVIVLD